MAAGLRGRGSGGSGMSQKVVALLRTRERGRERRRRGHGYVRGQNCEAAHTCSLWKTSRCSEASACMRWFWLFAVAPSAWHCLPTLGKTTLRGILCTVLELLYNVSLIGWTQATPNCWIRSRFLVLYYCLLKHLIECVRHDHVTAQVKSWVSGRVQF